MEQSKLALQQKILSETQELSSEVLSEVLDFIQFLKAKPHNYSTKIKANLTELDKTSLLHLEEEFQDYQKQYPYE